MKRTEEQLKRLQDDLRQREAKAVQNSEQEDKYEKDIHALTENLKNVRQ